MSVNLLKAYTPRHRDESVDHMISGADAYTMAACDDPDFGSTDICDVYGCALHDEDIYPAVGAKHRSDRFPCLVCGTPPNANTRWFGESGEVCGSCWL